MGKLLIVILALLASLTLVAAPLSVLLISAVEDDQILGVNADGWNARRGHSSDRDDASDYAEFTGITVAMARAGYGLSKAEAAEKIEDAYQSALPGRALRMPAESSSTGTAETFAVLPADGGPEQDELVAALQQYRDESFTELDRPGIRGQVPPQVPAVLVATGQRVSAAAEAWERAENLSSQRESDEAIRQIRQERGWQKILVAAVLVASGLFAARTARTLTRRRRAIGQPSV